jgi:CHAD domain-containing protein
LAAERSKEDIEYVHQLRVTALRARVAARMFADLLPKRQVRWMKKWLRALRHAAGDARDLDVLGLRLGNPVDGDGGSGLEALLEQVAACRCKAQKPLVAACEKVRLKGFKKRSRRLAEAASWQQEPPEPTFAEAARATLTPLVEAFLSAAAADLADVESLHQMRLSGKRVRYAMELLAGAFGDSFRGELFATFEEIQEKLGTINDHASAIAMFQEWSERADSEGSRAKLAGRIAREEQQLDANCREFRSWWTTARAAALAERFAVVLRSPELRPSPDEPPGVEG